MTPKNSSDHQQAYEVLHRELQAYSARRVPRRSRPSRGGLKSHLSLFAVGFSLVLGLLLCATMLLASGCDRTSDAASSPSSSKALSRPQVIATTTILADLVEQIGGDAVTVVSIMKPGGDPHLYQPTPRDAKSIASSDLVVTNGLQLEGWIDQLVRNAGGERPIIVASEGVKPVHMPGSAYGVDPHFWFDVQAFRRAGSNVRDGLIQLVNDTSARSQIEARFERYDRQLEELDKWVEAQLQTIPENQRVLVTSHDAFNYFGRAYPIEVRGIQGISTQQEASQRDVANTIDLVRARSIPAVFVESTVNPALIKRISAETGASVAGPLYSDSLGIPDSPAGNYVGMVSENVRMVTESLGGLFTPLTRIPPRGSDRKIPERPRANREKTHG